MLQTFVSIIHIFVCLVLMGVVLLQQGKGGGMGAAFGGATTQVFGGRGAGNILTRATAICAAVFMVTSVVLAYMSSSGDRALRAKVAEEETKKKDQGTKREKQESSDKAGSSDGDKPAGTPGDKTAPSPKPADSAPAP